jgi:hypothetical protein
LIIRSDTSDEAFDYQPGVPSSRSGRSGDYFSGADGSIGIEDEPAATAPAY